MVKMGTVWDRTAEFLSDNIAAVVPIALLAFFVPACIGGNFAALSVGATFSLMLVLRLIQLAFAVLSLWGSLAITAMALDMTADQSAGTIALHRLPKAILVSLVMLAAVVVLVLPIPGVLAANGYDMAAAASGNPPAMSGGMALFVSLYGLALAVVLLWLFARLSVATPLIVREREGLGALGGSWHLTRGVALRIVGVILLYVVVSWVAQLAANTVFGSIFTLVAGTDSGGLTLAGVLTSIVVAAVQTAFMVLAPAFLAKLYLALTGRAGLRGALATA